MGSSRPRNSIRARKAHFVKHPSRSTRRRATRRIPVPDGPSLADIGAQLRDVVRPLERVEAYLIVAGVALEQCADYSGYIRVLLRIAVGNLLFKQVRALADLAARCDGGPSSERDHEDDPDEDDDTEGQPRKGDE